MRWQGHEGQSLAWYRVGDTVVVLPYTGEPKAKPEESDFSSTRPHIGEYDPDLVLVYYTTPK